ncbi:MAG: hypothetical protein K2X39_09480, partial [Silvanigrellaceae bacterium]|nr:hypothetical protein [Silvanigrellaceae bacterium]
MLNIYLFKFFCLLVFFLLNFSFVHAENTSIQSLTTSEQTLKSGGLNIPIHTSDITDNANLSEFLKDKIVISPMEAENLKIKSILIMGNDKTNIEVIKFYILLKPGDIFQNSLLFQSVQNLKNTTNFSQVYSILSKETQNSQEVTVTFFLNEKWTLLPYIFVGGGGGSTYAGVGFYDSNILGRSYVGYMAAGCKNKVCSQLFSFTNPHFQNRPIQLGIYGSHLNVTNTIYNTSRKAVASYSYEQFLGNAYFEWVLKPSVLSLGPGFTFLHNKITSDTTPSISENTKLRRPLKRLASAKSLAGQFRLTLGEINVDGLRQEGMKLTLSLDFTPKIISFDNNDYTILNSVLTAMLSQIKIGEKKLHFPNDSYFASRLGLT